MTSIDKLLIQNIRSFGPSGADNIIQFYKPLTIIVGHNGAGKTTIIECLKYATTGDFPPNCQSGQAFVHDPKIAGVKEVKAQIKLKFKNVKGEPVVVTRSLQVTQKTSNKLEFKSLEGAIQLSRKGERITQSHRCADIDMFIPQFMGASSAILNSVIFCHQEESNWPLGDPKTVKKKLDDIFCSTRYNKALEEIKKQVKTLNQQSKETSLKLETIKTKKQQYEKIKNTIQDLNTRISSSDSELEDLTNQLQQYKSIIDKNTKLEEEARAMINKINELKSHRDLLIRKNEEFHGCLQEEYLETDEELLLVKQNFEVDVQKLHSSNRDLTQQLTNERKEKLRLEQTINDLKVKGSSVSLKLDNLNKILDRRDTEIKNFISTHKQSFINEGGARLQNCLRFTDDDVEMFNRIVKSLEDKITQNITLHRQSMQEKRNQLSNSIGSLKIEASSLMTSQSNLKQQKTSHLKEVETLQVEIQKNQHLISQIENIENQIKDEESSLQSLLQQKDSLHFETAISEFNDQKKSLDDQLQSLNTSLTTYHQFNSIKSKLDMKKHDRTTKQSSFQSQLKEILKEINEHYLENFQTSNPSDVKDYLQKKLQTLKDTQLQTQQSLSTLQHKHAVSHGNYTSASQNLLKCQSSYQSLIDKVKSNSSHNNNNNNDGNGGDDGNGDDDDLPAQIAALEKTLQSKQKFNSTQKSIALLYQNYMDSAKQHHDCPLCERQFEESSQLTEFVDKMNSILLQVPKALETNTLELKQTEASLKSLTALLPSWNEAIRLKTIEIPTLTADQQLHLHESSQLKLQLDQITQTLQSLKHDESKLQHLLSLVEPCSYLHHDYILLLKEEKQLEEMLPPSSDNHHLNLDQLNSSIQTTQSQLSQIQQSKSTLESTYQSYQSKINGLYQSINSLKGSLISATNSAATIERQRKRMNELQKQLSEFDQSMSTLSQSLLTTNAEIDRTQSLFNDLSNEANRTEKQLLDDADSLRSKLMLLRSLSQQISDLSPSPSSSSSNTPSSSSSSSLSAKDKLIGEGLEIEGKITELENQIEIVKRSITSLETQIDDIKNKLSFSTMAKRNLDDNIKYRDQQKEIKKISDQLLSLESSSSSLSSNPQSIIQEKALAQQKYNNIKSKKDSLEGSRKIYFEQIKQSQKELSQPSYHSIDDQFSEMTIKLNTSTMAKDDLERYHTALDKALMKYHNMKIEEINKILKELWQSTYQGQDIDTVEIRADCETKSRSFNYRVCMIKGDTELEMRGRCSAGQKVLTSLIIRLALAETLGVNCGIIALDEPTTNLDRSNVESFAKALVTLIENRRKQSNFQLIVITHDEEFVQLLGRSEQADYYWRISKDSNNNSRVSRCEIADLA